MPGPLPLRATVGAALLAASLPILSGCGIFGSQTLGIGLPPTYIYRDTTTPMGMRPPRDGGPIPRRTDEVQRVEVSAHAAEPHIPGPGFIYAGLFPRYFGLSRATSVGWGDIGFERYTDATGIDYPLWADARTVQILGGIYTRSTLIVYGIDDETADRWMEEDRKAGLAFPQGPPQDAQGMPASGQETEAAGD